MCCGVMFHLLIIYIHVYTYIYIHVYAYIYIHIYICIYIHAYIYMEHIGLVVRMSVSGYRG